MVMVVGTEGVVKGSGGRRGVVKGSGGGGVW